MFRGWTIDQTIETPLNADRRKKDEFCPITLYNYNGQKYTAEELAELDVCPVSLKTLQGRLNAG